MRFDIALVGAILRKIEWWYSIPILFLVSLGLVMQYTIGLNQEIPDLTSFYRQLTFASIGLGLFVFFSCVSHRFLKTHPFVYYAFAFILLITVLLFGTTIKGTTGWFVVGSLSVQPVELVKLLIILFISTFFAKDALSVQDTKYVFTVAIPTAILISLVMLQPDLGSSLVLFVIWFSYMIFLKAPRWFIGLVIGIVIIVGILGWLFLFQDYQKERLTSFIHPSADPLGAGYNSTQSIVAVGSGSMWGKGLGLGTQSQLHFLPEVSSDFIFAAIAEELGFVGVLVMLFALSIVVFRLWKYMSLSREYFSFLFLLGVLIYLTVQSVLVIGMNIGLLPVTGVPLPLVSAGGTSMVVTLSMLGIAHNIAIEISQK